MKTTSKRLPAALLAAACAFAAVSAHAPDDGEKKFGYVRLVDALCQGTGKVTMMIDGKDKNPEGYQLGDVTGGVGLKPGAHAITIRRDGVKEGTTTVNIAKDETTTLIPFAEKIPASDSKPAYWEIRILRLKQRQPESDRGATFVSVCQEPDIKVELGTPDGKWNAGVVHRLTTTEMPIEEHNGYVPIQINGVKMRAMEVASKGNYVVIVYEDEQGKIKSLHFQDFKYLTAD